jgi:transposase
MEPALEQDLLREQNIALKKQVHYLQEQIHWLKRQLFGRKSEKIVHSSGEENWLPGFEDFIAQSEKKEELEEVIVPEHRKRKPNRNGSESFEYPEDLPTERLVLDIAEEEKVCSATGKPLVVIGEDITRKLAKKAATYYIKEIVRIKYGMPKGAEEGVKTAPLPSCILPKCQADESLLADIVCMKFADHLPLYRISEIYQRESIQVSRQLLSQWILRLGSSLKPLYKALEKRILESGNVFVDETPVDLLEKGKGKVHQAIMWAMSGGECNDPPDRIYRFTYDRKTKHAHELLLGYEGVFHSDKYRAYVQVAENKDKIWCPCWVHVRRKFVEAETGDVKFTAWVLRKIKYLFMLDRIGWGRTAEERLKIRQEKSIPIIDELIAAIKGKLTLGKMLPKSKYREALGYFISLIPYLKNYTNHAYARLDNNVVERAIRPLTIGRKNWLFVGSEEGGEAAAILLSLVQTCRGYSINPREYLEDVFRRLMDYSIKNIDDLLPGNWKK